MQTSMRRRIASVALAVLVAFGCGALTALAQETAEGQTAYAAQQGTWKKSSGKWWYAYNGGGYAKSGWAQIGGKWYLFDGAGWMKTGWQQVGGKWYHLSGSGAMQTGWLKDGKTWYYLNQSGAMATGWQKVGGSWYYLKGSGAMAANTWIGDYYVDGSGVMATNCWIGKYYVDANGKWDRSKSGTNLADTKTVYWVDNGEVYHLTKDCVSLKRSTGIHSGTVAQSGKSRVCSNCG